MAGDRRLSGCPAFGGGCRQAGGSAAFIGVPSEVCLVRMGADSKKCARPPPFHPAQIGLKPHAWPTPRLGPCVALVQQRAIEWRSAAAGKPYKPYPAVVICRGYAGLWPSGAATRAWSTRLCASRGRRACVRCGVAPRPPSRAPACSTPDSLPCASSP